MPFLISFELAKTIAEREPSEGRVGVLTKRGEPAEGTLGEIVARPRETDWPSPGEPGEAFKRGDDAMR